MDAVDDPDMTAIMGFSSFTEMPKPKRQRLDNTTNTSSLDNPNNTPLGQRGDPIVRNVPTSTSRSKASQGTISVPLQQPASLLLSRALEPPSNVSIMQDGTSSAIPTQDKAILMKELEELTSQDLYLLRKGLKRFDGRIVFFTKGFIEDPWNKAVKMGNE